MKQLSVLTKSTAAPVILIVLISFLIRIYNLNYNSPFLDEAQYIVLGDKVLAGHWQEGDPFSWVGGMPLFYPPLSAFFANFGILGARLLNVLLGTLSIYLMYEFSKSLLLSNKERTNEIIGLVSAGFMGVLAIPIYLSRLAIYDMLSFTLLLIGLVFLQKALLIKKPNLRERENRFFISAIAIFLSFLAKYTTLILFPFILILALYYSKKLGKEAFSNSLRYFATPLIVATLTYIIWNFSELQHFLVDQVGDPQNRSKEIISQFSRYTTFPVLLAFFGSVALLLQKKFLILTALLMAAAIPLFVHLFTNSLPAAHQHTYLSLIFIVPLAAFLFGLILEKRVFFGSLVVLLTLVVVFIYSQSQVQELETSWVNTDQVMTEIKVKTSQHEKILSFEDDVTKLSLTNLDEKNIKGIFSFEYNNLTNENAYQQALKDGYFDLILFNEHSDIELAQVIKTSTTKHYKTEYKNHPFVIYKLDEK